MLGHIIIKNINRRFNFPLSSTRWIPAHVVSRFDLCLIGQQWHDNFSISKCNFLPVGLTKSLHQPAMPAGPWAHHTTETKIQPCLLVHGLHVCIVFVSMKLCMQYALNCNLYSFVVDQSSATKGERRVWRYMKNHAPVVGNKDYDGGIAAAIASSATPGHATPFLDDALHRRQYRRIPLLVVQLFCRDLIPLPRKLKYPMSLILCPLHSAWTSTAPAAGCNAPCTVHFTCRLHIRPASLQPYMVMVMA